MSEPPDATTSAEFPGWSIWTSKQDGRTIWWGTRTRLLTESEMRHGLLHTLCANSGDGLRVLLAEQAELERGIAAEPVVQAGDEPATADWLAFLLGVPDGSPR